MVYFEENLQKSVNSALGTGKKNLPLPIDRYGVATTGGCPDLHFHHLPETQIYKKFNLPETQIYTSPNLHETQIYTKPNLPMTLIYTKIYTKTDLHRSKFTQNPYLHRPQYTKTQIYT